MRFSVFAALVAVTMTVAVAPVAGQPATDTPTPDGIGMDDARDVVEDVADQEANETETETPIGTETPAPTETDTPAPTGPPGTVIDSQTSITSSEYDGEQLTITFRSYAVQTIYVADAGQFQQGGTQPVRTVAVGSNDTGTIRLPVTQVDGMVGVSISTDKTALYAHIVQNQPTDLPFTRTGPVAGWLGGASVMLVMGTLAAVRIKRENPTDPQEMR